MNPLLNVLGFTPQEKSIWIALQKSSYNVSRLSRITKFPRTTLYTALSSLKRRGLIRTETRGKSVVVSPISPEEISHIFKEHPLESELEISSIDTRVKNTRLGFNTIRGKKDMLNVWVKAIEKGTRRISVIQPSLSLINMVKHFRPGEFIPLNNAIKKHRIIMDAIIREDNLPTYLRFHKNNPRLQKEIIKSFIGRMADATFVRDTYLNNQADLIIVGSKAYLMNWKDEIGIEIENRDMIELLQELFELAKGYGRKIDFNQYMKEYLQKLKFE